MNFTKLYQYERNKKIYVLRCKGYKYKEISKICGVSVGRARQIFVGFDIRLKIQENIKKITPAIQENEKKLMWGLYYILDDIKNIAEK